MPTDDQSGHQPRAAAPDAGPSAHRAAESESRPTGPAASTAPELEIEYCTQCRWLPRATWMAQEILTTFERDLGRVALVPGTGGVFEVRLNGDAIWSRSSDAAFTDAADLKRAIRDRIAPDRPLGHSEQGKPGNGSSIETPAGGGSAKGDEE